MKLYEIAESYRNLLELLENGEIDKEILTIGLNEVEGELVDKLTNITYMVKEMEMGLDAIAIEQQRLLKKKKALSNSIENLKGYMKACMSLSDKRNIKANTFTWSVAKNPLKVIVKDTGLIPEHLLVEHIEYSVDKKAVLELYKNGEEVEGVEIVQEESLRIK